MTAQRQRDVIPFPSGAPRPAEPAQQITPQLRLRDAYEKLLLAELQDGSRGNLSAYETALRHWEQRTDNPLIDEITGDTLLSFKRSFQVEDYANDTIMKNWRHVRAILRRCGPWEYRNPQGEGLLKRVPYLKPLKRKVKIPRIASFDELSAVYEACSCADWPRQAVPDPPVMWRAVLVLFANYGPRTQDGFGLPATAVDWVKQTISFVAQKTGKLQGLPLNRVTLAHLKTVRGERARLFPVTACKRDLYGQWKRIQAAAGLSELLEFRDLRETCCSNYEAVHAGVGKWILGHAEQGVTDMYYCNPAPQVLRAVHELPQPAAFLRILDARD